MKLKSRKTNKKPLEAWGFQRHLDEIILGNFKGKESLPLANRGNTFVSLRGVLEILSKTELSSDIVDNFQLKQKPLAPTHKSKGFSFCRRQVHWGVDSSPATNALKICPDDSAIIRADFPRTPLG